MSLLTVHHSTVQLSSYINTWATLVQRSTAQHCASSISLLYFYSLLVFFKLLSVTFPVWSPNRCTPHHREVHLNKPTHVTPNITHNTGPYTNSLIASLAYLIPIVDASDLGKYMFEAYPDSKFSSDLLLRLLVLMVHLSQLR